ncbi:uncharacterized protein [Zea mays]|uniref:uncharacterized protein n=1 Tax=Zea mays TaxID=4577 RepID=UPI0016524794|nr:uncharacterized protein LOC118476091 [Zea mays]
MDRPVIQRKAPVWRRLSPPVNSPLVEKEAQGGMLLPVGRMKKKRRRSKRGKGSLGLQSGPSQPHPNPPDAVQSALPRKPSCVLEFSTDLARKEAALRRALFVSVVGTRPMVRGDEVIEELARSFSINPDDMSIQQATPEDFLLFLPDEHTATQILNEGRPFRGPGFSLNFKRWTRFSHASTTSMAALVDIEIRGIPAHAWDISTAKMLLQDSCWVLELLRDSGTSFLLRAWCFDPKYLHSEMELHIVEPGSDEQKKRCLSYNISMTVSSVPFQMTNSTETLSPSSDDGQFDEGNDSDPADSQQRRLPPQPPRESVHLWIGAQFVSGRSRALCSVEEAERMGLGASSGLNAQHSMRPLEDCPTWGDEMGMQLVCGASGPSRQICGALGPSRRICGQPSIDACVAQLNNAQLDARAGSFISVERSQESPSPSWKQCRQLANEARDLGVRAASFNDEERTKVPLAVGSLNQLRSASPQYHLAAGPLEGDRTDSPQATGPLGFTGEARQDDLVAEPVDWATTDLTHQMYISETERTTLTLGDHEVADSGRKSSTGNLLHQSIHCTTGIEQPGMLHIRGLQSSKKLMVYSRKRFNSRDKSGNMNEEGSGPIASVLRIDTDENTVSTVREVSLAVTTDDNQSTSQETQTGSTQLKNKQFLSKLSKKISGLLATPEDPPFMTSKNAQVAEIIPRRSRRIAGVGVEFDNMDLSSRTTKKVMQALKVIGDPGAVTQQAKEDYLKVFSTELPISHIEALASFFGWVVPDDLKVGSISVGISAC